MNKIIFKPQSLKKFLAIFFGWSAFTATILYGPNSWFVSTALAALCILLISTYSQKKGKHQTVPNAPWVPLLGSLPMLTKFPERKITEWGRKYGSVFAVYFGNKKMIILNDLAAIREAFVKNAQFTSGRHLTPVVEETTKGNGIIFMDADKRFTEQRKFWHRAMKNINQDKRYFDKVMNYQCNRMIDDVFALNRQDTKDKSQVNSNNNTKVFNYFTDMIQAERNIPLNYTPHIHAGLQQENAANKTWKSLAPHKVIHDVVGRIFNTILFGNGFVEKEEEYMDMNEESCDQAAKSSVHFLLVFLMPLLRKIPPVRGIIDSALLFRTKCFRLINSTIEGRSLGSNEANCDFVNEYLKQMQSKNTENCFFNKPQLFGYLMDILCASVQSTSTSILWLILFISHNQDVQSKLRDEIYRSSNWGDSKGYKDLSKMSYLQAVIQEILRLRPVSPLGLPHKTTKSITIAGYHLPKNTLLMPNLWGVNHNDQIWMEPEKFCPERHLSEKGDFVTNRNVIPFSIGSRQCLGQQLAKMVMSHVAFHLVQNFEFRCPEIWNVKSEKFESASEPFKGKSGHILHSPYYQIQYSEN